MNHYPRHIGDWIRDTAHLSSIEECMYSRMIDQYYARECPLPADIGMACRLARAVTTSEKRAVDLVLREFFVLEADGWHQKRCDAELARFREGQVSEEEKRAHESDRQRRHRERRKELFATLRERGQVPAWDTPTTELERLCHAPVTPPVTRTATAIQNQNQNQNQNQEPLKAGKAEKRAVARASKLPPDWRVPVEWLYWAEQNRPDWTDADLHRVAAVFTDHWRSKGEARADWEATWRNWVRREKGMTWVSAKQDARTKVADQIWGSNERPAERVIDGEAKRVA